MNTFWRPLGRKKVFTLGPPPPRSPPLHGCQAGNDGGGDGGAMGFTMATNNGPAHRNGLCGGCPSHDGGLPTSHEHAAHTCTSCTHHACIVCYIFSRFSDNFDFTFHILHSILAATIQLSMPGLASILLLFLV